MACDHVLEALAVAVAQLTYLVDVERAGTRRGAEQAAPEAGALLVRPVDQAQADGRLAPFGLRTQGLERAQLAEGAVRPTGEAGQLAQVGEDAVGVHHEATAAAAPSERGTNRPCPGWVRISP